MHPSLLNKNQSSKIINKKSLSNQDLNCFNHKNPSEIKRKLIHKRNKIFLISQSTDEK